VEVFYDTLIYQQLLDAVRVGRWTSEQVRNLLAKSDGTRECTFSLLSWLKSERGKCE
jgi:hypothetical protein